MPACRACLGYIISQNAPFTRDQQHLVKCLNRLRIYLPFGNIDLSGFFCACWIAWNSWPSKLKNKTVSISVFKTLWKTDFFLLNIAWIHERFHTTQPATWHDIMHTTPYEIAVFIAISCCSLMENFLPKETVNRFERKQIVNVQTLKYKIE